MELTERPEGVLVALPQRGLLRRREEAPGDAPARASAAAGRGPRRDRLRPRHRRAERRRPRRGNARPGRPHRRPDHHPLPAHPPPRRADPRAILFDGRIVKEGGPELVDQLEAKGYGWIRDRGRRGGLMGIQSSRRLAGSRARVPGPRAERGGRLPRQRRTSQKPRAVIDAIDDVPRASEREHPPRRLPARAGGDRRRSRARAAASRPGSACATEETVFTKNVTEAINLVAYAWGGAHRRRGRRGRPHRRSSTTRTSCRGSSLRAGGRRRAALVDVDADGTLDLDAARRHLADGRVEARRGLPRLERARHDQPGRRDRRAAPTPPARSSLVDGARPCRSMPRRRRGDRRRLLRLDRRTRSTGRPASASCTAAASCSRRCRRSSAAAT